MGTQGNYGSGNWVLLEQNTNFCNYEGIELIKSPVKDHRATGMVERTIGSLKKTTFSHFSRKTKPINLD